MKPLFFPCYSIEFFFKPALPVQKNTR